MGRYMGDAGEIKLRCRGDVGVASRSTVALVVDAWPRKSVAVMPKV